MPMEKERGERFEGLPEDEKGRSWQERNKGKKFKSIMNKKEFSATSIRESAFLRILVSVKELLGEIERQKGLIGRIRNQEAARRVALEKDNKWLKGEVERLEGLLGVNPT